MTVEVLISHRLIADAGVTALVAGRVYLLMLPPDPTLPAIRVQVIDEPQGSHLRGLQDLTRARVQVDAFADEESADPYGEVAAISEAVDSALINGLSWTAGSPASRRMVFVERIDRRSMYEGEELRQTRMMSDYYAWSTPVN